MASTDVAIIIVTYRSAGLTIDCLRSIESQAAVPGLRLRCVVVDNASGDSPAIAEAIAAHGWGAWVRLVTAERNGGFAYGNNLGVREVYQQGRPDYLHLINPDTVLRPGAIAALVQFLEAHPAAAIAGSSFENADGSDWAIAFRFPSLLGEVESGLHLGLATRLLRRWQVPMAMGREAAPVDWVSGASMMVRRELLDAIGGMDESFFLYFEETEFCFRAKAAGASVWYVPESRVMHIAGQSTKVTERNLAPRRLPAYWFESRRRYFALTGGTGYAIAVDVAALLAFWVGGIKRLLQRRGSSGAPHFLRDMVAHSLIWPRNRRAEEPRVGGVPRFLEDVGVELTELPPAWQALLPAGVHGAAGADAPAAANLSPAELQSIAGAGERRRDEFRLGRWQARRALAALGRVEEDLPRLPDGAPAWPAGVVGSIAHTAQGNRLFAVAVVADAACYRGLGVDVEAPGRIEPRFWPSVFLPVELDALLRLPVAARARAASRRWSAKEAVVKACGEELRLSEVAISLEDETGRFSATSDGRVLAGCEGWTVAADDGWAFAVAARHRRR